MAEVGINTVKRVEQSAEMAGSVRTLWKIQTALEKAGIEFIGGDATKGPGVRLVKAERIVRTKTSGRAKSGKKKPRQSGD